MPRSVNPRPQFFDSSGDPLVSGLMYYFDPGTTTPKTTYSDVNLTTANAHPVVLSADGRLPNVWFDGSARQVLRDADGVLIWDVDPVGGANITGPLSQWSPDVTYSQYDIVITSTGVLYRSLINANTDNNPTSSPTAWEKLEFLRIWNTNVTYALNDTVKASDGLFYRSLANGNIGNNPTTDAVNWGPPVDILVLGLADGGTKSADFNSAVNTRYLVDTFNTSAIIVTGPAAPAVGSVMQLEKFGLGSLTFNLNGLKFNGLTTNPVSTAEGISTVVYTGTDRGYVEG